MDIKGDSVKVAKKATLSIFVIGLILNISFTKVKAQTDEGFSNININKQTYSISNKVSGGNNILDNLIVALTGRINGYEVRLGDKIIGYTSIENDISNITNLVLKKYISEMKINGSSIVSFKIDGDMELQENKFDVALLQTNEELASDIYDLSKENSSNLKLNIKYIDEDNIKIQPNTIIIPSDSMYLGETKVEDGEVGLKKQVKEVIYENDKLISTKIVKEEKIKEAISKKVYRGTKNPYHYGIAFLKSPTRGGDMTSGYGERWNSFHKGIDIAGNTGDDVLVAMDGEVIYAQYNDGGYGNLIMVKHEDNMITYYGHLNGFYVKVGDKVKKGEVIGAIGNTGFSTGPHLHFELRVNNEPVDPTNYIVQ